MKNLDFLKNLTGHDIPVIVVVAVAIIAVAILLVIYTRHKSIEDIREDVYELFLKAEHLFEESGAGEEKLDWVVEAAYPLLPKPIQFIVTPSMLKIIIDKWFKGIKDLLDDGKLNGSAEDEEEPVYDGGEA